MAAWREAPVVGVGGTGGSSDTQMGMAAAAGMEAAGKGNGKGGWRGASWSGISLNSNRGGWSVGREDWNHRLLYIWILKGVWSGCGSGE